MYSDLSLNIPARTYGAVLVSGTLWSAYTFTPGALSFAKYSSGPLILWARPGEGENVPGALTPTLSTLEERAVKVNTRAVFERLFWAGRGSARHSIRWKTGWAIRRRAFARVCLDLPLGYCGDQTFEYVLELERRARRCDEDLAFYLKESRRDDFLLRIAGCRFNCLGDIDQRPYEDLVAVAKILSGLDLSEAKLDVRSAECFKVAHYAVFTKDRKLLRKCIYLLNALRLEVAAFFKSFEAAAYRAHLACRVKPVQRRTRIRRPLYARPRPPTAPTAPPLHEASA